MQENRTANRMNDYSSSPDNWRFHRHIPYCDWETVNNIQHSPIRYTDISRYRQQDLTHILYRKAPLKYHWHAYDYLRWHSEKSSNCYADAYHSAVPATIRLERKIKEIHSLPSCPPGHLLSIPKACRQRRN